MTTERQNLVRGIIFRARTAVLWLVVVVVLLFAALWRGMPVTKENQLVVAAGICAAIAITRLWNLLDDARDLLALESRPQPQPTRPAEPPGSNGASAQPVDAQWPSA